MKWKNWETSDCLERSSGSWFHNLTQFISRRKKLINFFLQKKLSDFCVSLRLMEVVEKISSLLAVTWTNDNELEKYKKNIYTHICEEWARIFLLIREKDGRYSEKNYFPPLTNSLHKKFIITMIMCKWYRDLQVAYTSESFSNCTH